MKTLHINTERTWRGGEQQTINLLNGLEQRKVTAHLVCQADSPLYEKAKEIGIETFPMAMHGEVDLAACLRIRKLINRFGYDIIHSHTSHAHTLAFFSSFGIDINRIVTRRVDFSIFRHSFLKLSGLKYRYMADFYIAISHKIKEILVEDGISADRIFVAHSGINPDRFALQTADHLKDEFNFKPGEQVVINVAHLARVKGQQYLVKAIPLVLARIPTARFFIISGGELMDELRDLARSLGVGQAVVFTGFRSDVGAFYQIADLFVMCSLKEGLGTAILDALALGKPVVATDCGGIPEIIQDGVTGRLVPPADPSALAEGIIEMFSHRERARQMGESGRTKILEMFSAEAMVEKNLEIYHQILKG